MSPIEILTPGLVACQFHATSKKHVLEHLAEIDRRELEEAAVRLRRIALRVEARRHALVPMADEDDREWVLASMDHLERNL